MTRPAIQRRFSTFNAERNHYGIHSDVTPFDPRPADQRPKPAAIRPADMIAREPDPMVRADAEAELTDHDQLVDFAGPRPDIARRAFDLFAPDVANEKPTTPERRAAMHSDRRIVISWLKAIGYGLCAGLLGWSLYKVADGVAALWQLTRGLQ